MDASEDESPKSPNSPSANVNSNKSPTKTQEQLFNIARKFDADFETKTVFEQLAYELRNIQYCINFEIELASKNLNARASRIQDVHNHRLSDINLPIE